MKTTTQTPRAHASPARAMKAFTVAAVVAAAVLAAPPAAAQRLFWTVFIGSVDAHWQNSDVNEDAAPIATPYTADPAAEDLADVAYFRFGNYPRTTPRGIVTLTYCLGGTATGGTAMQVAANPAQYDYTWPTGYDPGATTPPLPAFRSCIGRGSVTIPTTATGGHYRLGLDLNDDSAVEGDETITALVLRVTEAGAQSQQAGNNNFATLTIKDNDFIAVSIANAGADADPAAGFQVRETRQAVFTVTLSAAVDSQARVPYTVAGLDDADYAGGIPPSGAVLIPAGETSGEIRFALADDADDGDGGADETAESFTVTLAATGYSPAFIRRAADSAEQSATQIVIPGMASRALVLTRIDAAGDTVMEGQSPLELRFLVTHTGAAFAAPTVITWRINHAATAGSVDADFAAVTGTITYPDEDRIAITVAADNARENDKHFSVTLDIADADADGGTFVGRGSGRLTLRDDDAIFFWSVFAGAGNGRTADLLESAAPIAAPNTADPASAGLPGVAYFRFSNYYGRAPGGEVTLTYCLSGGAAGGAADDADRDYTWPAGYDPASTTPPLPGAHACTGRGTVTVPADAPGGDYRLAIALFDDGVNEADETITAVVVRASEADGGESRHDAAFNTATRTIKDDDAISVSIANAGADADAAAGFQVSEGGPAQFTVTLSAPGSGDVMVPWSVAGLEAADTTGADPTSPLTIAAGDTTGAISFALAADDDGAADEGGEAVTVTLGSSGYTAAGGISRTAVVAEQSATQTVVPGSYARTLVLTRTASAAADAAAVTGAVVVERDAAVPLYFRVSHTGADFPGDSDTTVTWTIEHAGTVAADFSAVTGTIAYPTVTTFTFNLAGDNAKEADEYFTVTLSVADPGADSGTFGAGSGRLTLRDDDSGTLYWSVFAGGGNGRAADVRESAAAIAGPGAADPPAAHLPGVAYFRFANYTDGGTAVRRPVTIIYCLGGTASGGAADDDARDYTWPANYDPDSTNPAYGGCTGRGTVTVPNTAVRGYYRLGIALHDDNLNEGDETITAVVVRAREAGGGSLEDGGFNAATRTIKDNDPISVSIANAGTDADAADGFQVREAGAAAFTVTLDKPSAGQARVAFAIAGLEAADYAAGAAPASPLVIPAGDTTGEIRFALAADADAAADEAAESFTVTIAAAGHTAPGGIMRSATAAEQRATQTVIASDAARALLLTRTESDYATPVTAAGLAEGGAGEATAVYFAVSHTGADFPAPVTITWTIRHALTGRRTTNADFSATTGAIDYPTESTFTFDINGNAAFDGDRRFSVALSVADADADGGTSPGPGSGVLRIDDDEAIVWRVQHGDITFQDQFADREETSEARYWHFDFVNAGSRRPRGVTVVTYCMAGTTTGGSAAQVAADPARYDYTWPTANYDPADTSPAAPEFSGDCATGRGTFTIAAGRTSRRLPVAINDDRVNEPTESLIAYIVRVHEAGHEARVDATQANRGLREILRSDRINVGIANAGVDADGGTTGFQVRESRRARFTVTLFADDGGSVVSAAGPVRVPFTITGLEAADYATGAAPASPLVIPAGQTRAEIRFVLAADADGDADEMAESVTVGLPSGGYSAPGHIRRYIPSARHSATQIVIAAATTARTLALTRTEADYATPAAATAIAELDVAVPVYFAVSLESGGTAFAAPVAVTWTIHHAVIGGLRGTSDADFSAVSGSIMFPSETTFTFDITGDDLAEGNEFFSVDLSVADPDAGGGTSFGAGSGQLTVRDDDQTLFWTVFAGGGGGRSADLNEDAAAIATPATADPASAALPDTAYFRFANYAATAPLGEVTLTYCLAGGARGVTQTALDADATLEHDYIYPAGYDPAATTPTNAGYAGDCTGRGQLTVPTTAAGGSHRLGIELNDDGLNEGDETITAVVVAADEPGYSSAPDGNYNGATRTIKDNDPISVSIANAGADADADGSNGFQVSEGRPAAFTVTLSAPSAGDVSVPWSAAGLEAADTIGADPTSPLSIAAGQTTGTLTFTLALDADSPAADETSEDFTVTLGETGYAAAGGIARSATADEQSATQKVVAAARSLTVTGPATIAEADATQESGDYTITLTGAAFDAATTVTWTVTHGTTDDADFVDAGDRSGTVEFAASDADGATKTFTISIAGDSVTEGDETFTVQVSAASAGVGAPAATTIADDDTYTLTLAAPASPAEEGGAPVFTVTYADLAGSRARALAAAAMVTATVTGAAPAGANLATGGYPAAITSARLATPADDFAAATVTCAIPMGTAHNTAVDCTLPAVTDDTLSERVEHYRVALSGGSAGVAYGAAVFHTIAASDPINMSLDSATYTAAEGGQVTVRVNFSVADGATVTAPSLSEFRLLFDNGVATYRTETPGSGDAGLLGATPVWARADGSRHHEFTVSSASDTVNEADDVQTWRLRGSIAPVHVALTDATATITFTDDDPVTVAITRTSGSGAVGEGSGALSFTVTLAGGTRASGVDTVVPFTVSGLTDAEFNITAPQVDDGEGNLVAPPASATGGTLTIAHGATTGTITVALLDDALNEAQKTVTVTGAAAGDSGLRLTGSGAGAVEYTASGDTASVAVADDDAISISIANAGSDANDDASGHQVVEGGDATFTVTLGGAAGGSAEEVTVAYTIGGDVEAADYTDAGGGTLTIPANTATGTITIGIASDADTDTAEDLTVTLSETGHSAAGVIARSATAAEQSATASITPPVAHAFTLTSPAASIAETDEDADTQFTLTRAGPAVASGQDLVVTWAVSVAGDANTATAADFSGVGDGALPAGTVTYTAAETGKTFNIGIAGDDLNEAAETFTLTFSIANANQAAVTANGDASLPGDHAVSITDDDPLTFTLARAAPSAGDIDEGASQAFTITPSGGEIAAGDSVTVAWEVITPQGSFVIAADFRDSAGATTSSDAFPNGEAQFTNHDVATVTVYTFDDNAAEGPRVFDLVLGSITGAAGAASTAGSPQTVAIASSDTPLSVTCATASPGDLAEGMAATVANCRHTNAAALVADVLVQWALYAGHGVTHATTSPTAATVFEANSGALTLPADTAMGADIALQLNPTAAAAAETATAFSLVITTARDAGGRYAAATVNHAQDLTVQPPMLPQLTVTADDVAATAEGTVGEDGMLTAATVNLSGSVTALTGAHAAATYRYDWVHVTTAAGDTEVTTNPIAVTNTDTSTAAATFAAPDVAEQTALYFRLTVTAALANFAANTGSAVATVRINDVENPTATINTATATVAESTMTTLDAAGADNDQAANTLTYKWTVAKSDNAAADLMFSDPDTVTPVADATTLAEPTVTWPAITAAQRSVDYTLTLSVTDAQGLTGMDAVTITVEDRDGTPTANAGADRSVATGQTMVALDGSGSRDAGGGAELNYAWAQVTAADGDTLVGSGSAVALSSATAAAPTFTAPSTAGALHFRLTVTDTQTMQTANDRVTITAQAQVASPTVAAGADQTVAEGQAVTLMGRVTRGAGDSTSSLNYAWVQIVSEADTTAVESGAGNHLALTNAGGTPSAAAETLGQSQATFTAPAITASPFVREFFFRLTGTAREGVREDGVAADTVKVTVNDNTAPTAEAGAAQTVPESTSSALAGRGSDSEGDTALTYAWTHTPATPALSIANTATPTVAWPAIATTRGAVVYTLTLTVTDSANNMATDTVQVTVHDSTAPTAAVASAAVAADTGQTGVTLDARPSRRAGGGSPDDNSGISFVWEQVAGASSDVAATENTVELSSASAANPTFTAPAAEATLWFKVTVTDGVTRATAAARVTVAVTFPDLPTPTVTVSALSRDEGTLADGALTLATIDLGGSASVAGHTDATFVYAWAHVTSAAGDTVVTANPIAITNADTSTAAATFTAPDVDSPTAYHFRLTATASKSMFTSTSNSAVLTVTINDVEPPTATITTAAGNADEGGTLTLAATAADPDSDSGLTYAWTVSPNITPSPFSDAAVLTPTVTWPADIPASERRRQYTLTLTVTDSQTLTGADSVRITVLDKAGAPQAAAGADRNVATAQSVTLSGGGSTDAGGGAELGYDWDQITTAGGDTEVSAMSALALTGSNTATVSFTAPAAAATLHFRLTVTDTQTQQTHADRVTVTVTERVPPTFEIAVAAGVADADNAAAGTQVSEGVGQVAFTVRMTGDAPTADASVRWAASGVAVADDLQGYPATGARTLTFTVANYAAAQTVTLRIADDDLNEAAETLSVTLGNAASADADVTVSGTAGAASVEITDNDAIALTATATTAVREGGNAVVNLDLGAIPSRDITVAYAIGADADANTVNVGAADYTDSTGGSVTIAAAGGVATGAITIALTADNLNEAAETFTVTITAADITGEHGTATVASGGEQTFTIAASDPLTASIAADSAAATEGGSAAFTVTLTGATAGSAAAVTVAYSVALTGRGYAVAEVGGASGNIEIAAGQTSGAIRIALPTDGDLSARDPAQTLSVTLGQPTVAAGGGRVMRAAAAGRSAQVTVNFVDAARTLTVTGAATHAETDDASTVRYTVAIEGRAFAAATTLTWTVTPGSASAADFSAVTGTIEFPTATAFDVTIAGDNDNEAAEDFSVQIAVADADADGGTATGRPATTAITDDDALTATLSGGGDSVAEGAAASFTVTLSGATHTADVVFAYATDDATGRLTIAPGATTGTLVITAADDAVAESAETFTVDADSLAVATAGAISIAGPQTFTIAESDAITVTIAADASRVNAGRNARFSVRLSNASMTAVTVTYDTAGLVTAAAETVTIAAGQTAAAIAVAIPADALMAGDGDGGGAGMGEVTVTLTGAAPATGGGNAMVGAARAATVTVVPAPTTQALHAVVLPEATRAVVGQQFSQVAARAGQVGGLGGLGGLGGPVFNWNGQSNPAGVAAVAMRDLADGDLDAQHLLRDFDFAMPLSAGDGDNGGRVALWGGGDYRGFSGQDGDTEWDGGMWSAQIGVDGELRAGLRAGLLASYSDSKSDYSAVVNGAPQSGEYQLDLTALSPYLNWRRAGGGSAWLSATAGEGEVEVTPDGGAAALNEVRMAGLAGGGSWRLRQAGARELRVQVDAFAAQTTVDGAPGAAADDLDIDASRLRVALALRAPQALPGGANLTRAFDFGARYDGGDGRTGAGMEAGGQWRYHNPARGLTVQGGGRALLAHSADAREWGVGGLVRLAAGADGQGAAVTITPAYGDAAADPQALWERGVASGSDGDSTAAPKMRVAAEAGYGVPAAAVGRALGFGERGFGAGAGLFSGGMFTPYTALRWGESARDYRFGLRWSAARGFALDLSARRANNADAFAIEGRLKF